VGKALGEAATKGASFVLLVLKQKNVAVYSEFKHQAD
jgi:hypothetical protein